MEFFILRTYFFLNYIFFLCVYTGLINLNEEVKVLLKNMIHVATPIEWDKVQFGLVWFIENTYFS